VVSKKTTKRLILENCPGALVFILHKRDGYSMTGFVFKVVTGPLTWCAEKQSTITLSSADAAREAIWLKHLLEDLG